MENGKEMRSFVGEAKGKRFNTEGHRGSQGITEIHRGYWGRPRRRMRSEKRGSERSESKAG